MELLAVYPNPTLPVQFSGTIGRPPTALFQSSVAYKRHLSGWVHADVIPEI
ncbi:hypothetical protein [Crateriforma spongiae]|uniref:hypothetical protein n=1 Tax=Crateriforma spongiae TaxID=2724528 RepID=UPI0014452D85|nr:hypothetical protein [Crateriforma spongiae]